MPHLAEIRFNWLTELDQTFGPIQNLQDFYFGSLVNRQFATLLQPLPTDQCRPGALILLFQQQDLCFAATRQLLREDPSRDHAGLIDHQQIAGLQETSNGPKVGMFKRIQFTVQNQQAGIMARVTGVWAIRSCGRS